jgi:hypothetical protein
MSWIFPKDKNGERRFGCWAVNPKGEAENPLNCIAEVKGVGWVVQAMRKTAWAWKEWDSLLSPRSFIPL